MPSFRIALTNSGKAAFIATYIACGVACSFGSPVNVIKRSGLAPAILFAHSLASFGPHFGHLQDLHVIGTTAMLPLFGVDMIMAPFPQ
jgi:hypothetical protein